MLECECNEIIIIFYAFVKIRKYVKTVYFVLVNLNVFSIERINFNLIVEIFRGN